MQLGFEFYTQEAAQPQAQTVDALKAGLEEHIKISGLVAYKDFYMKIKNGVVLIPQGLTKEEYLSIAREVYESRAAKVNRDKSRRKYFAIKNKNKKR